MKLCDRIQMLRIKHDMTQKELSAKINVSMVSINGWERGTRKPSADAIVSLSQVFGVSTDFLLGMPEKSDTDNLFPITREEQRLLSDFRSLDSCGKKIVSTVCSMEKSHIPQSVVLPQQQKPHIHSSARYIPKYITPSAAGLSAPLDGDDFTMVLVDDSVPDIADFAVTIQGTSMEPYIKDGDVVYVQRTTSLSNGEVGIFCVNGAMYCKQYYVDDNGDLELVSANENQKHTNLHISKENNDSVVCYGRVLLTGLGSN